MLGKLGFIVLLVALVAVPGLNGEKVASAQTRTRLVANGNSGAMKFRARYEERGSKRKFNFQLEKGQAGQVVTVKAGSVVVGTATVNNLRRAAFELQTERGQAVPAMSSGTTISVWIGGVQVMSGNLR
ncbi:MAG: hypothetical protein R3C03_07325 [Pirellulaceae bacterium]